MNRLIFLYRHGKPVHDMLRARRIHKSHVSLTGAIRAAKDGLDKAFESPLERDFLVILDFDWEVDRFYDQPVKITYRGQDQQRHTYTPDVLIYYRQRDGSKPKAPPLLAEIKRKCDLRENMAEYRERFAAAERFAARKGWTFRVLTEDDIRTPYLANARFLREFRDSPHIAYHEELLTDTLTLLGESTPARLIDEAMKTWSSNPTLIEPPEFKDEDARAELITALWRMVTYRQIETDLGIRLTMASRIWLRSEES